ncbi:MAG: nuclear transport factor 2 family protein [Gemmatimonadetes bacterium]|nr:nuclear transport factor 2 family protein [Gemmatimonadota bacterium]
MGRRSPPAVLLLLGLLAACTASPEQALTTAERSEIEQMLFEWEEQWLQTTFSRDASHLERILADDLVYTIEDGTTIGKQEMIASWVDEPNTYTTWVIDDVEAHWFSDEVVLVIGGDTNEGTDPDGNEIGASGRFTNVFIERDGIWQMAIGHYTPTG